MVRATSQLHQCPTCDRVIRGPGFFRHVGACLKQLDLVYQATHAPVNRYTISNGVLYHASGRDTGVRV